jgi:hypothetical protein
MVLYAKKAKKNENRDEFIHLDSAQNAVEVVSVQLGITLRSLCGGMTTLPSGML